jgi:hypothetical protein
MDMIITLATLKNCKKKPSPEANVKVTYTDINGQN